MPKSATLEKIVASPEFQKWFGKSVVKDAEGLPLEVYHGTDAAPFNAFKVGQPTKRYTTLSEHDAVANGVNFSPSAEDAATYGERVEPFFLSAKRPLINPQYLPISSRSSPQELATHRQTWDDVEHILAPAMYEENGVKYIDTNGGVSRTPVDENGDWLEKVFADGLIDWHLLDNPEVVSRMKARGYDSAKVYEPNDASGMSWFVTDPRQIKHAVKNAGTFDPTDPNFLKAAAPVAAAGAGLLGAMGSGDALAAELRAKDLPLEEAYGPGDAIGAMYGAPGLVGKAAAVGIDAALQGLLSKFGK